MITINVQTLLIWIVLAVLAILLIYAIFLIRKLLVTISKTNDILDDAKKMTTILAERTDEVNGIVTDVSGVVSNIAQEANNNQGLIKTATNMSRAAASAFSYVTEKKEEKEEKEFQEYKKAKKAEKKAEKKAK